MGLAYAATLEENESFATLELKINFLPSIRRAALVAEGVVTHGGRNVGLTECTILDQDGRLVAKASSTYLTISEQRTSPQTWLAGRRNGAS
jgi:uncharacterized protein (TIGR00369 family)